MAIVKSSKPSDVGTLEVRVLRPISSNQDEAIRAPSFDLNGEWWDVSKKIDNNSNVPSPSMEIG